MHIFPEGATTTGMGGLLKFKKGAFASLTSVAPVIIKYDCPAAHVEGSNVPSTADFVYRVDKV